MAVASADVSSAPASTQRPARRPIEPADLLMIVLTFGAMLAVVRPIQDINDVFWHILLGNQLRDGVPFAELGSTFSFSVDNPDWRTGAWASEVSMSWLYDLGGWTLLTTTLRIGSILGVALVLWWTVVRRWPSRATLLPYALAMTSLAVTVQERPQSWSYVFIAITGAWWYQSLLGSRPPKWWQVGLVALVWANLHGLWVLLPGVLALAFVGRLINHGISDAKRAEMSAALLASLVGGLLTPLGPSGLLLATRIRDSATDLINEWAPTALFGWPGYVLLVVVCTTFLLLGRTRATRGEYLFAIAITIFGLMASRNVTPAVLLLAPLLASLLYRALGSRALSTVSDRERTWLRRVAIALVVTGISCTALAVATRDQGPSDSLPVGLASQLEQEPSPIRLLNDYNWSGVSLFYGGPGVQVGADGRADYYGSDFLDRYQDAVVFGSDFQSLVDDLDPTHALLPSESAAAALLQSDEWTIIDESDDKILLRAP